MRTCVECGVQMMTEGPWEKLTTEERAEHRARGVNRHHARGLCPTCYCLGRRLASRTTRPVAHVAEDWAELVDNRLTQKANVRNLAPRLGMTEGALERAVLRAKRRGLIEVAA